MVISKVFRFELDIHLINSSVLLAYHLLFSFCTHAHSGGEISFVYALCYVVRGIGKRKHRVKYCHVIFRNLGIAHLYVRILESVLTSHVYMLNITFISGSAMHMLS